MAEEEETFAGLSTAALSVLLLGLETRLDACLGSLMRANWASVESVRIMAGCIATLLAWRCRLTPAWAASFPPTGRVWNQSLNLELCSFNPAR